MKGLFYCIICVLFFVFDNNVCYINCFGLKVVVLIRVLNDLYLNLVLVWLSNGFDYFEGVLEIFYDGVWGIVCDDGWDVKEILVVCREFGFGKVDIMVFFGYILK